MRNIVCRLLPFMMMVMALNGVSEELSSKLKIEECLRKAKSGDARAQYDISCAYEEGQYVEKDDAKAFEWLQKAADGGEPHACDRMGWRYLEGCGIEKDEKRALVMFTQAASDGYGGCGYSCAGVAYLLLKNEGSTERALDYCEKFTLSCIPNYELRKGYFPDSKHRFWKAWDLLKGQVKLIAEKNDGRAQYLYADLLHYSFDANVEEAAKWYERAAQNGVLEGRYALEVINVKRSLMKIRENEDRVSAQIGVYKSPRLDASLDDVEAGKGALEEISANIRNIISACNNISYSYKEAGDIAKEIENKCVGDTYKWGGWIARYRGEFGETYKNSEMKSEYNRLKLDKIDNEITGLNEKIESIRLKNRIEHERQLRKYMWIASIVLVTVVLIFLFLRYARRQISLWLSKILSRVERGSKGLAVKFVICIAALLVGLMFGNGFARLMPRAHGMLLGADEFLDVPEQLFEGIKVYCWVGRRCGVSHEKMADVAYRIGRAYEVEFKLKKKSDSFIAWVAKKNGVDINLIYDATDRIKVKFRYEVNK